MHRDIFIYGFGSDSGREQSKTHFLDFSYRLMPVFEKYKVDAVLTAHLHTYRRRVPLQNFAPAPQGSGVTYILTGVAGDVRILSCGEILSGMRQHAEAGNCQLYDADGR